MFENYEVDGQLNIFDLNIGKEKLQNNDNEQGVTVKTTTNTYTSENNRGGTNSITKIV